MPTQLPYNSLFSETAAIEMAGKCHTFNLGDSQSTPVLDYLWYDAWLKKLVLDYHYFCIAGANTGQVAGNNFGYATGSGSVVDAALTVGDVGYIHSISITSNSAASPTIVRCAASHGYQTGNTVTIAGQTGTVDINGSRVVTVPAGTISAISIAANPQVTTSVNHGLSTNDTVLLAGTNSTPAVDGLKTITVTGVNTYTIGTGTTTTGAGTSGTWTAAAAFTVPVDCTAGGGSSYTACTAKLALTSYSMGTTRLNRFTANLAAGTLNTASGLVLVRQLSPSSHANSSRQAPWPTLPANSSQPWFHGSHVKAKIVVWKDSDTLDAFAIYMLRQGTSASNSTPANRVQVDVSAASTGPVASPWSDVLADQANYDSGASGILNDHECSLRMYSSSAAYDETGKTLIPLCAIFARCDAGGTIPWNLDNSGCGFAAMGRAGAGVSNWLNYCTQAHWQAYFTATVLVPDACTKIRIMLGHNLDGGTSDVGDGDGPQAEQTGTPATTTAAWKKRYKDLISRLRSAYMAAFPSGKVCFELIVPWRSGQTSSMTDATTAADVNRVIKAIAEETGSAYFSYYEYWDGVAPFWALHAWQPANGDMLATALRNSMDRATNYRYSDLGEIQYSRQIRGSVRV
jgi:hypothetical protein